MLWKHGHLRGHHVPIVIGKFYIESLADRGNDNHQLHDREVNSNANPWSTAKWNLCISRTWMLQIIGILPLWLETFGFCPDRGMSMKCVTTEQNNRTFWDNMSAKFNVCLLYTSDAADE